MNYPRQDSRDTPTQKQQGEEEDGSGSQIENLRVSIKHIDHYSTKPVPGLDICYSPFSGQEVQEVPVIRVFGSTPAGQTVCLHVHKILPHLYVPCPEKSRQDQGFLRRLAHSIDIAVQLSLNSAGGGSHHDQRNPGETTSLSPRRRVHLCTLVRAKPFYGHHECEEVFIKVYIYNPQDLSRVANVLLSGAVMGCAFQPYESHIPYLLKFKTDYNLHGIDYIDLSRVLVRHQDKQSSQTRKESLCDIEVDAFGESILNRAELAPTDLQASSSERTVDVQLVPSLAPIWAEERERSRKSNLPFPPEAPEHPRTCSRLWLSDKFKGKFVDAVVNEVQKEAGGEAERSRLSCPELLHGTQAANESLSPNDAPKDSDNKRDGVVPEFLGSYTNNELVREDKLMQHIKSTQEVDDLLYDALEWMVRSEREDADVDAGAVQLTKGDSASEAEANDYINASQKECDDIVNCTLQIEVDRESTSADEDAFDSALSPAGPAGLDSSWNTPQSCGSKDAHSPRFTFTPVTPVSEDETNQCNEQAENKLFTLKPLSSPPTCAEVEKAMQTSFVYQEPFFSRAGDAPKTGVTFAGKEFKTRTLLPSSFEVFGGYQGSALQEWRSAEPALPGNENEHTQRFVFSSTRLPPARSEVLAWLQEKTMQQKRKRELDQTIKSVSGDTFLAAHSRRVVHDDFECNDSSVVSPWDLQTQRPASPKYDELFETCDPISPDISPDSIEVGDFEPPTESTPANGDVSQISPFPSRKCSTDRRASAEAGFKFEPLHGDLPPVSMPTVLSVEILTEVRGKLLPNPKHDAVKAIAIVYKQTRRDDHNHDSALRLSLLLWTDTYDQSFITRMRKTYNISTQSNIYTCPDEEALFTKCVEQITAADPDIIAGFDTQAYSVGYLRDRMLVLNPEKSFLRMISRAPSVAGHAEKYNDRHGSLHAAGMHSSGRIILSLWKTLRMELKLSIYSFQNCAWHLLGVRVPLFSYADLASWFRLGHSKCLEHLVQKPVLSIEMIQALDLVSRTSELARVYGIDLNSVLTRGSQYRVESLLTRLAHSQNYLMVSPSKLQVANQPAMECLPLVMEPESRFYTSPVLVLDFQSLYPSMVIAYNLCFSTLVGHVDGTGVRRKVGVMSEQSSMLNRPLLNPDELVFAPNGSLFTRKNAKSGVLPRMLQEILHTRQMLKRVMKRLGPKQKAQYRLLNARQLALKLLANVTYGYTAAGFSGRMPCAELADAIVQFGRETMEHAIKFVESRVEWQARVVYGDTDSIFVHLPGRSRSEAFAIGSAIAAEVTSVNPDPVVLKFEKVFHPCILLTKKRYVGYAYESSNQLKPVFDAKGIETVRRDTCPAVAKMLERSIRTLFESKDLSQVKQYMVRQWEKILKNRVNLQDFVFAKEVRLGTYSPKASVVPPAAIVAAKAMANDPRAEPKHAERIPYVVVHGEPGARLVDMVVSPETFLRNAGVLRLHGLYYITKQIIPALERCFSLLGGDVRCWFSHMPKPSRSQATKRPIAALGLSGFRSDALGCHENQAPAQTIDHFYLSRHCAVCDAMTPSNRPLCDSCRACPQKASLALEVQAACCERSLRKVESICSHCGGCDPSGSVQCSSTDCGMYFLRRKLGQELHSAAALLLSSEKFLL